MDVADEGKLLLMHDPSTVVSELGGFPRRTRRFVHLCFLLLSDNKLTSSFDAMFDCLGIS